MALNSAFAINGDKSEIPQNSSDGSVSYDKGFSAFYALPPEEGGLFIDRAQFNQLMYDTTSQVLENKQNISNLNSSTYNKTEINGFLNTKANANATTNLTGDQTINGVKTFNTPPISATNPTQNNQVANKAYVDSVGNAKVATTTYNADKATFATKTELNTKANQSTTYNKTEVNNLVNAKANANATVNLTGNQTIAGVKTFNTPPISATNPTQNNQVANKAYVDSRLGKAYITETYVNGTSWYRVWSDKFCEQGGKGIAAGSRREVALLKPYKNTDYSVITNSRDTPSSGYQICIYSRTATTFSWYYFQTGGTVSADWIAFGYIA